VSRRVGSEMRRWYSTVGEAPARLTRAGAPLQRVQWAIRTTLRGIRRHLSRNEPDQSRGHLHGHAWPSGEHETSALCLGLERGTIRNEAVESKREPSRAANSMKHRARGRKAGPEAAQPRAQLCRVVELVRISPCAQREIRSSRYNGPDPGVAVAPIRQIAHARSIDRAPRAAGGPPPPQWDWCGGK